MKFLKNNKYSQPTEPRPITTDDAERIKNHVNPITGKRKKGNPNIHKVSVPFTTENNITDEQRAQGAQTRKKKTKERRELFTILSMKLKGPGGAAIADKFEEIFGIRPRTIEEGLHFAQVIKGITSKDTFAYTALMQGAGLNKALKIDTTSGGKPLQAPVDYSKMATEDLLKLKEISEKYAGSQP